MSKRVLVLTVSFLSVTGGSAWGADDAPTIDTIRAAYESVNLRVQTAQVDVDLFFVPRESLNAPLESASSRYQYEFGWRAGTFFYFEHCVGQGAPDVHASFDGTTLRAFFPASNEGYIRRDPFRHRFEVPLPWLFSVWDECVLFRLREDNVTLQQSSETVAGAECLVVSGYAREAGKDLPYQLLLDSKIGYMPREIHQGAEPLRTVIRFLDYSEKDPGLWLPNRIEWDDGKTKKVPIYVSHAVVLNPSLPEEFYDVTFPPGATVYDETSSIANTIRSARSLFQGRNGRSLALALLVVLVVLALFAGRWAMRRKK